MAEHACIDLVIEGPVATLWMNRPEVHNAFDESMIAGLTNVLSELDRRADIRVVVLAGRGKSFSSGADLQWMKRQGQASREANLEDAERLAGLMHRLANLSKPSVARVHGAALGGGLGLAACCDICIATLDAVFATSEVRFGIIPAVISPYVIHAIGARQCTRYFQTAERITAERALALGLAHEVVPSHQLDSRLATLVADLLAGGPQAQQAAKRLIQEVTHTATDADLRRLTAERIADLRATDEAAAGLSAFLNKERAPWRSPLATSAERLGMTTETSVAAS